MKPKALLSWSSGKDSAWALHRERQRGALEIVALVTTFNEAFDRVAMHAVRRELVVSQARQACLPLWTVPLPWPCSNYEYEQRMKDLLRRAREQEITHFIFGDLFLEDIRAYREAQLAGSGIEPVFPLWCERQATPSLAREMIAADLQAYLTCVDPQKLPSSFAGRKFDARLLDDLPASVDPCGENGEFHSFCYAGPMFQAPILCQVGEQQLRDGFIFADLLPAQE